ncbi:MAG TPA: ACP S-malonyltransferase, partial [Actinomycetota bacterium]|nr:ACP S-malonyltransferase [Actinomycetota bacterium]
MRAAIMFPGQGSQFTGMVDVWTTHDAAQAVLDDATDAIGRDVVAGGRDEGALATTEFVQPAILACDVAAFRVLEALGVGFVGAAGHSLGEFAALVAAGVLELTDALRIVAIRGRAMQAAGEARPGTMTALLGVGSSDAAALCDQVRGDDVLLVANENSPRQVVISGSVAAIERAEALAAERKLRAVRLNVAGAFHSPLMEPAVEPLSAAISEAAFAPARFPIASNVTGTLVTDPTELRALAQRQVVSPVRWEASVGALRELGADIFVEAGPGDVLTKLAKRAAPGVR